MKITIETKPAVEFEGNELFLDRDGDTYIRCEDGIVGIDPQHSLIPYVEKELTDYTTFPYLEECTPLKGKLKIKIKI